MNLLAGETLFESCEADIQIVTDAESVLMSPSRRLSRLFMFE